QALLRKIQWEKIRGGAIGKLAEIADDLVGDFDIDKRCPYAATVILQLILIRRAHNCDIRRGIWLRGILRLTRGGKGDTLIIIEVIDDKAFSLVQIDGPGMHL